MNPPNEKLLQEQREMLEKIYVSVEKTRKYFLWTLWGTIIAFVLPIIAMGVLIPFFMSTYVNTLNSFTGAGLGF